MTKYFVADYTSSPKDRPFLFYAHKKVMKIKIVQVKHKIPIKTVYFLWLGDWQPHPI